LGAAAWTYVAAAVSAIGSWLLYVFALLSQARSAADRRWLGPEALSWCCRVRKKLQPTETEVSKYQAKLDARVIAG